jgi:hypothetical protein
MFPPGREVADEVRHHSHMERSGGLYVDSIAISNMPYGAPPEMRAVFTDSMLRRREATIGDYYADSNPTHDPFDDQVVEIYELVPRPATVAPFTTQRGRCRGRALALTGRGTWLISVIRGGRQLITPAVFAQELALFETISAVTCLRSRHPANTGGCDAGSSL